MNRRIVALAVLLVATAALAGYVPMPAAPGLKPLQMVRVLVTAGAGGAPDDVTVWNATAPTCRIVDQTFIASTTVALGTVELRTAAGGGGSSLSGATLAAAVPGTIGLAVTTATTRAISEGSSAYLRRSDSAIAGELLLTVIAQ